VKPVLPPGRFLFGSLYRCSCQFAFRVTIGSSSRMDWYEIGCCA
jgi:hypothetical protein